MENQKMQNNDYDEIDLRQLANTLVKRRSAVIIFTITAAVIAFVISIAMPKVYRTQIALQIGTVGGVPVESVIQIKDKIDQKLYSSEASDRSSAIKTSNIAGSNIITLTVDSSDRQKASELLGSIGQSVIDDHAKIIAAHRASIDSQILTTNSDIKDINVSIKTPNQECSTEKYLAISNLESRVANLEFAKTQIKDTVSIGTPVANEAPVKPNVKLNTVMAAILGLLFGIFAVLVGDWWKQKK
jgi:uncharacterized protein involved in exopolysaccharide biosynthesis